VPRPAAQRLDGGLAGGANEYRIAVGPGSWGARSGHGRQQLGQADQSRRRCWLKPLRTALDRRGNPFLELTPALRAHVADSEPLFFEIDGHPNAEGYRLIARLVADLLMGDSPRTGMVNRGGGGA
jgi:hypothetical protein